MSANCCKDCKYRDSSNHCDYFDYIDLDYNRPKPLPKGSLAAIELTADDDQGLDARIRVSDDFGCVAFQPRRPK